MRRSILTLAISIIIPLYLSAQQEGTPTLMSAKAFATFGLHQLEIHSFNSSLSRYDLPALDATGTTLGAGGGIFFNRIYFGGQGAAIFGISGTNAQYSTTFSGGFGFVQAGYVLIQKPWVRFYPSIGLGGGGSAIRLSEGPGYSEDDLTLQTGKKIHSSYMIADFGVNGDFLIGSPVTSGFLIGLSLGYQLSPVQNNWTYKDQELSDLEKFGPQGFYAKMMLGWNVPVQ